MAPTQALYIFIDEGGDFNFSPSGTKYFTLTSVTTTRPFKLDGKLTELRFDLIESGAEFERFHATEDKQATRDQVFGLIQSEIDLYRVDSVIVEKCKTGPSLREPAQFYPRMLGYLLRYVIRKMDLAKWSQVIVITDSIPVKKKRKAIEKGIKETLSSMLPENLTYRVMHHDSRSSAGLQIVDYFNWAIYRKWKGGDTRSYKIINSAVMSEFDIFRRGKTIWYAPKM